MIIRKIIVICDACGEATEIHGPMRSTDAIEYWLHAVGKWQVGNGVQLCPFCAREKMEEDNKEDKRIG